MCLRLPLIVAAVLFVGMPSHAADASVTLRAFVRGDLLDALALARLAEEAGDPLLVEQLARADDRALSLIAVRASAYAAAPERVIPGLAALACGRDPALAPEAAHAMDALSERLSPTALALREVLRDDLVDAKRALACGAALPTPRADIAASIAALSARLEAW